MSGDEATEPETPAGKVEFVGRETIDGEEADKYRAIYDEGSGLIWLDAETHLPLRMEAEGGRVDFKNYQFGPQPAELFQVPNGYEVMDLDQMMAGMPKGMGGMMGSMSGAMAGAMGGGMIQGPLGAMASQFVGENIGQTVGGAAAGE